MGNAYAARTTQEVTAVHPHVHGERGDLRCVAAGLAGSSPRAWGTPEHGQRLPPALRFIPTCMGNAAKEMETAGQA